MAIPTIVIVGRPNVGKSTLFNRMTRSRAAIVEDIPGVTRDRNYREAEWHDRRFMVVDTGGFYVDPPEDIFEQARELAFFAIEEGDLVVHLLDGKEGLTPADMDLARRLRSSGKNILWAVNKIDAPPKEALLYDFYAIGSDQIIPVSAATGHGFEEFMERVVHDLPEYFEELPDYPKVAVVGRPNVGKSTLVNSLAGRQRSVVSPVPGTTRDAIDSICSYYRRKYIFIDTAGLRRKGKIGYSIERFSVVRTVRSIERCDVALILLDVAEGITEQDLKVAGIVKEYGKGAVFLLNKWDLVADQETVYPRIAEEIRRRFWFSSYAPLLTVSGLERKRITKIFPLIDRIIAERRKRISTGELNRFFQELMARVSLPLYKGRTVKLYYMTQVEGEPPTFVIFANYKAAVSDANLRYIERGLRERFGFEGTPVRIFVKVRR